MSKFSTKGCNVHIELGSSVRVPDTITSATAAKPVVVTPETIASFSDGDIVVMAGTGMPSIDNRAFLVANTDVSTFELCGSDGTRDTAATAGTASPREIGTDTVMACCNTFSITPDTPPVIDASTFCGVEQLVGDALPGNMTLGGFIDGCDAGFLEIEQASEDGLERVVAIEFPSGHGWLMCVAYLAANSKTFEYQSAAEYSGGGPLRTKSTLCAVCK